MSRGVTMIWPSDDDASVAERTPRKPAIGWSSNGGATLSDAVDAARTLEKNTPVEEGLGGDEGRVSTGEIDCWM